MSEIWRITQQLDEDAQKANVWVNGDKNSTYEASDGETVKSIRYYNESLEVSSSNAEYSAFKAEEAAKKADAASTSAQIGSRIYKTVELGMRSVEPGQYFNVQAENESDFITLYLNDNGAAVEVKRYPSSHAIENINQLISSNKDDYLAITGGDDFEFAFIGPEKMGVHGLFEISNEFDGQLLIVGQDGFAYPFAADDVAESSCFIDISKPLFTPVLCLPKDGCQIDVRNILYQRDIQSITQQVIASVSSRESKEVFSGRDYIHIGGIEKSLLSYLTIRNTENNTVCQMPLKLVVPKSEAQNAKILLIGDSITNRQLGSFIMNELAEYNIDAEFIGTINGSSNAIAADDSGVLGEAREGWETGDFTLSINDRAKPVDAGDEQAYILSEKNDKWPKNPFIRPSTEDDDSSIINNGYVVDFEFYQQRFNLDTPDVVVIQLGTNDIRDRSEGELVYNYQNNMSLLIQRAKEAWPNVKILLSLPGAAFDDSRDAIWETHYYPLIRSLINIEKALKHNVTLVPAWALTNSDSGFSISSSSSEFDELTGAISGRLSDPIHLVNSSRHQLACSLAAYISAAVNNQL